MSTVKEPPLREPGEDDASFASRIEHFVDIADLMSVETQPVDWLVQGLFPRRILGMLAGSDGTLKSYGCQALAVAVASGGEFLGKRCRQTTVLYVDYENPVFEVKRRLRLLTGNAASLPNLRVWGTWLEHQPPQLLSQDSAILARIAREEAPLIVFDPFRFAHGSDENDSSAMGTIMLALRSLVIHGATVLIIHHSAKAEGSTGRGSSAIRGACDIALLQELDDASGFITLKATKNRFGERFALTIRPDYVAGRFELVDSPFLTTKNNDIVRLKEIIALNPGMTQTAICDKFGGRKEWISQLLRDQVGKSWRTENGPRKSTCYYPVLEPVPQFDDVNGKIIQ